MLGVKVGPKYGLKDGEIVGCIEGEDEVGCEDGDLVGVVDGIALEG